MRKKLVYLIIVIMCMSLTLIISDIGEKVPFSSFSQRIVNLDKNSEIPSIPFADTKYREYVNCCTSIDKGIVYGLLNQDDLLLLCYNSCTKNTSLVMDIKNMIFEGQLLGISMNELYVLVVFETGIWKINKKNEQIKKIMDISDKFNICIYKDSIYYTDADENLIEYNIYNYSSKVIDEIKTALCVVFDDILYYSDSSNNGKLSCFDFVSKEIHTYESKSVIGFEVQDGELDVKYSIQ